MLSFRWAGILCERIRAACCSKNEHGKEPMADRLGESEIRAALVAGSSEVWGEIVERFYGRLLLYCGRFVVDAGDARDLVHDVFIKARRGAASYNDQYAVSTWLYAIARNTGLDYVRKMKRETSEGDRTLSSTAAGTMLGEIVSVEVSPRTACGAGNMYELIFDAMDKLSDDQAEVLMLRYIDNLARGEIATLLEIPENTVKSRLLNGLRKLRQLLPAEIYER